MTDTQLPNIAVPADAIEIGPWGGLRHPYLRLREFATCRADIDGVDGNGSGPLTVTLGGYQRFHLGDDLATDVLTEMNPYATVFISESRDHRLWVDLDESQLREAAAAFIAAADRLAAQ
jgi:hypothetical protein